MQGTRRWHITHVKGVWDHIVRLRFADGIEGTIDLEPYPRGLRLRRDPQRPGGFHGCDGRPGAGTIVWPNGADLALDLLYEGRRWVQMESEAPAS